MADDTVADESHEPTVSEPALVSEPAPEPAPEPKPAPVPLVSEELAVFFVLIGIPAEADDELRFAMLTEYLAHKTSAQTPKELQRELVAWMHAHGSTVEYSFPV